ncbi:MAG: hypothetical protein R2795_06125 [Saprospiraceae bacterium]
MGNDKQQMWDWKAALTEYLASMRLLLHPSKTHIHQTAKGIPFLGFTVFPDYKYVRKGKTKRYRRHLRDNLLREGCLPPQTLEDQLNVWLVIFATDR